MNMTQINLTLNVDDLKDHLMHSNLDAVVKSSLVLILNQMMESERDEHLNADAYERTSDRTDYRNGYYDRDFLVSIGKINLKVPRTRNGPRPVYDGNGRQRRFDPQSDEDHGTALRGKCVQVPCLHDNQKT